MLFLQSCILLKKKGDIKVMEVRFELRCTWDLWHGRKRKEENYIEFLDIKLFITIDWRGAIIGASKNCLGVCYTCERDRAPIPPMTA